jgi:endoglucanase
LLLVGLLLACANAQAQPVRLHGALSVRGTQLVDAAGAPYVLRGMSFGWHNYHPQFYNAGAVGWLASDWRCNVVRAAMGIEPEGAYLQNETLARRSVEAVVEASIRAGIYVIVDWHSHNVNREEAIAFFSEMAGRYGRYPNVIWEIFNEPDKESWPEVKAYAEAVIAAIRAKDPDNIILVGSPHWDQDLDQPAASPIVGKNLMYTMHFYASSHKGWLRDRCDGALKAGIPIFISESSGTEATGNGPIDSLEWARYISWAEERHISWVVWSVSAKNESCSVLQKGAATEGGWLEKDLKPSGRIARNWIRFFNSRQ